MAESDSSSHVAIGVAVFIGVLTLGLGGYVINLAGDVGGLQGEVEKLKSTISGFDEQVAKAIDRITSKQREAEALIVSAGTKTVEKVTSELDDYKATIEVPQVICSGVFEVEASAVNRKYLYVDIVFPGNDLPKGVIPVVMCEGIGAMVPYFNLNFEQGNYGYKGWFAPLGPHIPANATAKIRYLFLSTEGAIDVSQPDVRAYISDIVVERKK